MVMQYHWGLAPGHIYTHEQTAGLVASSTGIPCGSVDAEELTEAAVTADTCTSQLYKDHGSDSEDAEFGFENREDDNLGDEDSDNQDGLDLSDKDIIAMDDMNGP